VSTRLPAYGLGILTGLLLALLVTGGADARPATRDAIPAGASPLSEPDRLVWRTWTAPPSVPPVPSVRPAPEATPRPQPDVRPTVERKATPRPRQRPQDGLRGVASWFAAPSGTAAAGPALRRLLGRNWRGTEVLVTADGRAVRVLLSDFCQCFRGTKRERLIDLSAGAFARLAPLSTGVLRVRVAP